MKEYLKIVVVAVVAGLLAGAVVALVGGNKSQPLGQSGTRYINGISADSTSPVAGEVRGTTLTITGAATLSGATVVSTLTQGGGKSSTTTTTEIVGTIPYSAIDAENVYEVNPGREALVLTLPTVAQFTGLTAVGQSREILILNASSSAASNFSISRGDNMVFLIASTTPATTSVVVSALDGVWMKVTLATSTASAVVSFTPYK